MEGKEKRGVKREEGKDKTERKEGKEVKDKEGEKELIK